MAIDTANLLAAAGSSATLLDSIFKTEAVGHILMMVNVAILAVGTIWLTWNVLAGITQSAWDGEFLGKRFHTLWMPIRNAIGFAMLIPAFGGWGAAQLILYQAAKAGAGAANMAVAAGGGLTAPKAADFASPVNVNYYQQASRILELHLCREGIKIRSESMADPASTLGGTAQDYQTKFYDFGGCGKIDHIPPGALAEAHMAATRALDSTTQNLAARVAAGRENTGPLVLAAEVDQQLQAAAAAYKLTIEAASKASLDTKFNEIDSAKTGRDWLGFGFRTMAAAQAAREVASAAGKTATLKGSKVEGEASSTIQVDPGDPAAGTESFLSSTDINGASNAGSIGVKEFLLALKTAPESILKYFLGGATNLKTLTGGGGDLIGALAALGTSLLSMAGGAIATLLMLKAAIILLGPFAVSLIPVALAVSALVFAVVVPLSIAGITLGAYLALVPAIFWTLGIVGWLLVVAEALFMAPLWAFIHLETEGEGMGQKTEKGYAFIMNLLLRPLVLVFAFTIASLILNAVWAMLGTHISNTMASVDLVSFSGLLLFLGYCFVMVTTATALVYKVYGSAVLLADAIPAWLGTNFNSYQSSWGSGDGFGKGEAMRPSRPGGGMGPGKKGGQGGEDKPAKED